MCVHTKTKIGNTFYKSTNKKYLISVKTNLFKMIKKVRKSRIKPSSLLKNAY